MIEWILTVMGAQALVLTREVRDTVLEWGAIQQHVEVIPFCLGTDEHSYVSVPVRDKELTVREGLIHFHYHLANSTLLPQSDYRYALSRLETDPQEVVLQTFLNSLIWRQSSYFIFLVYSQDGQKSEQPETFLRGNFTYNLKINEAGGRSDFMIVNLGYTTIIGLSNLHCSFRTT